MSALDVFRNCVADRDCHSKFQGQPAPKLVGSKLTALRTLLLGGDKPIRVPRWTLYGLHQPRL